MFLFHGYTIRACPSLEPFHDPFFNLANYQLWHNDYVLSMIAPPATIVKVVLSDLVAETASSNSRRFSAPIRDQFGKATVVADGI